MPRFYFKKTKFLKFKKRLSFDYTWYEDFQPHSVLKYIRSSDRKNFSDDIWRTCHWVPFAGKQGPMLSKDSLEYMRKKPYYFIQYTWKIFDGATLIIHDQHPNTAIFIKWINYIDDNGTYKLIDKRFKPHPCPGIIDEKTVFKMNVMSNHE